VWSYLCFPIRSKTSRCENVQGWTVEAREGGQEKGRERTEEGGGGKSGSEWFTTLFPRSVDDGMPACIPSSRASASASRA
jgi:hypothetical protein